MAGNLWPAFIFSHLVFFSKKTPKLIRKLKASIRRKKITRTFKRFSPREVDPIAFVSKKKRKKNDEEVKMSAGPLTLFLSCKSCVTTSKRRKKKKGHSDTREGRGCCGRGGYHVTITFSSIPPLTGWSIRSFPFTQNYFVFLIVRKHFAITMINYSPRWHVTTPRDWERTHAQRNLETGRPGGEWTLRHGERREDTRARRRARWVARACCCVRAHSAHQQPPRTTFPAPSRSILTHLPTCKLAEVGFPLLFLFKVYLLTYPSCTPPTRHPPSLSHTLPQDSQSVRWEEGTRDDWRTGGRRRVGMWCT